MAWMPAELIKCHLFGKFPGVGSDSQSPRLKTWFITGRPDPYVGDRDGGFTLTKLRDAIYEILHGNMSTKLVIRPQGHISCVYCSGINDMRVKSKQQVTPRL